MSPMRDRLREGEVERDESDDLFVPRRERQLCIVEASQELLAQLWNSLPGLEVEAESLPLVLRHRLEAVQQVAIQLADEELSAKVGRVTRQGIVVVQLGSVDRRVVCLNKAQA